MFVLNHNFPEASVDYDDEDLEAWGFEAQRWGRLLFLNITEELQLEPLVKVLAYSREFSGSQRFQIHKAYGIPDHMPFAHTWRPGIRLMLKVIVAIPKNPDDKIQFQISLLYANISPDDILLKQNLIYS